jgi:hypothetical protein
MNRVFQAEALPRKTHSCGSLHLFCRFETGQRMQNSLCADIKTMPMP